MIAIDSSTAKNRLKYYCDKVTDETETVIVTRKAKKNVVIISTERYNELEKAERSSTEVNTVFPEGNVLLSPI